MAFNRRNVLFGLMATLLVAVALLTYYLVQTKDLDSRASILASLPSSAKSVWFVDVTALRANPFLIALRNWTEKHDVDPEYALFVQRTGFNYERDLQRLGIANWQSGDSSNTMAVGCGTFDHARITNYLSNVGSSSSVSGRQLFVFSPSQSKRPVSLIFLNKNCVAVTNSTDTDVLFAAQDKSPQEEEWQAHFVRLGGSPAFAVLREELFATSAMEGSAAAALRSPQLSQLLNRLQWITVAIKPSDDSVRVIAEAEGADDGTAQQLGEMLNGLILMAQAGLNDPKTSRNLAPALREAYLRTLKTVDVSKVDRGQKSAVRLVFDVSGESLQAASESSFVRGAIGRDQSATPAPKTKK